MKRGDVVIARFPYAGGRGAKVRPAVIVRCDRLNRQIEQTVLAMISGNIKWIGNESTQYLIDPGAFDGKSSGLGHASTVKCANLATVPQSDIVDIVGHLSSALLNQLQDCLKLALGID